MIDFANGDVRAPVELALAAALMLVRVARLRTLRKLPRLRGDEFCLGTRVEAGFYQKGEAVSLLRRYRIALAVAALIDAPVAIALMITRPGLALAEQIAGLVAFAVARILIVSHYAEKVRALRPAPESERPAPASISMEPRRLADHTSAPVEVLMLAMLLAGAAVAFRGGDLQPMKAVVWIVYLELGLLLAKDLFVRWRMRLPARRVEDYVRWRREWLKYHVELFDGFRLLLGAAALVVALAPVDMPLRVFVILALAAIVVVRSSRAQRRLNAIAKEIDPWSLLRELPPRTRVGGRFAAGGLLLLDRGNPSVVVRGPAGIAINAANWQTYAWLAYLGGLLAIGAWFFG